MAKPAIRMPDQVLAAHRLHFGRLYFQVIGVNLTLVVAAAAAVAAGPSAWWGPARLVMGAVLIGTGLVASRVHRQEEAHASALRAIEMEEPAMMQLPSAGRFGARVGVTVGLVAAGVLLMIEAAVHLAR